MRNTVFNKLHLNMLFETFTPVLIEIIRYLDIIKPIVHLFIVVSARVTVLSLFQLPSFPAKKTKFYVHHHHFICPIIQQYAHLHQYN